MTRHGIFRVWLVLIVCLVCSLADAQLQWEAHQLEFKPTIAETNSVAHFPFKNI